MGPPEVVAVLALTELVTLIGIANLTRGKEL